MEILSQLESLGEAVNNLTDDDLNSGGCCVYAALVSEKLKSLGYRARGAVVTWRHCNSIAQARNNFVKDASNMREWNDGGVVFSHVITEFYIGKDRYHVDSDQVVKASPKFKYDRVIPGRLKIKEMKALASKSEGWNDRFDRDFIPEIEQLVEAYLTAKVGV